MLYVMHEASAGPTARDSRHGITPHAIRVTCASCAIAVLDRLLRAPYVLRFRMAEACRVWRDHVSKIPELLVEHTLEFERRATQTIRDARLHFWQPAECPIRLLILLLAALFCVCAWSIGLWVEWRTPLAVIGPILIPAGVVATVRLIASSSSRHSLSVAGIVVDDDGRTTKVLMIKRRDNGRWQPPGGRLDADETIAAGLMREVREETGLHVIPTAFSGIYRHMDTRVLALVFLCEVTNGRILAQTTETTACCWLTLDEVCDRVDPAFAVRMDDALRNYRSRVVGEGRVRDHSGITQLTASEVAAAAEIVDLAPTQVAERSPRWKAARAR